MKSKAIRILQVFGRMNRGGAEMRTLDIMRNVDRQRYHLEFCALSGKEGELDDEINSLGGKVHLCPLGSDFANRFRRLLKDQHYDVVHTHVHYASGYILRLAAQEHIPVRIAHFRMTKVADRDNWCKKLQRPILRYWLNRHATDILAVSEATLSVVWPQWKGDKRCRVVYNGLDTSQFQGDPDPRGVRQLFGMSETCKLYIHVGRFGPEKNHARLVQIFAEILKQEPQSQLLLVGENKNDVGAQIGALVSELGIENCVKFAGVRSDVGYLLKAADILIFPSLWEGLPGAVLEACAANIPVLASDLPGVREIAAHFSQVRHLSLQDTNEEWANLAMTMSSDQWAGNKYGVTRFSESVFSIESCVNSNCEIWEGRG